MPVTAIVGAQWGDEGKGKITDVLAQDADLVLRFGGGANAGHTVINEWGEFKLHLLPSGIFGPKTAVLIGTGTVVDFDALDREIAQVEQAGVSADRLMISNRAHVVMPYHTLLDRLRDQGRGGAAIGTTGRGIGPAYVDKADRTGIQVGDLVDPDTLRHKLDLVLPAKNQELRALGAEPFDGGCLLSQGLSWGERYRARMVDQVEIIHDALASQQRILLEGQLGAMRDLDWGTYPFVTSSTTIAGGGAVGGGIPAWQIEQVLGVVKAYTTAVGHGPLPTELHDEAAEYLRTAGAEFGATTGRPRRVGWFDSVAVRYAARLNGFTGLAVTKLDVLDSMADLPICTGYTIDGQPVQGMPLGSVLGCAEPVYETLPGWCEPTRDARRWHDLPPQARAYLERIEELVEVPIQLVSVGPERDRTLQR